MDDDYTARSTSIAPIVIGFAIWLALAIEYFRWRLDLVEFLFLLAPWVIVPLASRLIPLRPNCPFKKWAVAFVWVRLIAAGLCTLSFFYPAGRTAGALASAWLLICLVFAADGLFRILYFHLNSFTQFCFAVGQGYLAVAGVWLVMSRLGTHPSGFNEPIVLLTAVHFHFAGFLSAVFAGLTWQQLGATRWARPLRSFLLGVVLGPGFLGIAFMVSPKLKLVAALIIAIGQWGLAAAMIRVGTASHGKLAGRLLQTAALCVFAGMLLAALWAIGEYPLHPFVDLYQMERIHGALNSVGFGFLGLTGWTLFRSSAV